MSISAIQQELLSCSPQERAQLIDFLWDSLSDQEIKAREVLWAEESERRIDAFDAGHLQAKNANDVFSELRKGLVK
jgi:putative addiction module component (TIGR02574 family)